jgi:hypothetical protein
LLNIFAPAKDCGLGASVFAEAPNFAAYRSISVPRGSHARWARISAGARDAEDGLAKRSTEAASKVSLDELNMDDATPAGHVAIA